MEHAKQKVRKHCFLNGVSNLILNYAKQNEF